MSAQVKGGKVVDTKNIIENFKNKKDKIFKLSDLCGKHENNIAKKLFEVLGWNNLEKKEYNNGLFGWKEFKTDKCRKLNEQLLIIEVKKVTEKSEYGYWHALIQGTLYSFLQSKESKDKKKEDYLILCIVLDWGRKAGSKLNTDEQSFINKFKEDKIYFIRINMVGPKFIEHNLGNSWMIIE